MTQTRSPQGRPAPRGLAVTPGALLRYRVMAYITGVLLIVLVLIGMPLKYLADSPGVVSVVGIAHGFLFMVYLVAAVDLTLLRLRWNLVRVLLVMVAGTVPIASFYAERYVTHQVRGRAA